MAGRHSDCDSYSDEEDEETDQPAKGISNDLNERRSQPEQDQSPKNRAAVYSLPRTWPGVCPDADSS